MRQPPPLEFMESNPLPYALGNLVAHRMGLWAIVVLFHIKHVHFSVSYQRGTKNRIEVVMDCLLGMGLKKKSAFLKRQLIADL